MSGRLLYQGDTRSGNTLNTGSTGRRQCWVINHNIGDEGGGSCRVFTAMGESV